MTLILGLGLAPGPDPAPDPGPRTLPDGDWTPVCPYGELIPGRGVAALLDPEGNQAAVFRTGDDELHAVGNLDPFTGAQVISRGLTGIRDGVQTIASPMLKHIFDLSTGKCVDGPAGPQDVFLPVHPVRRAGGFVYVCTRVPAATGDAG